MCFNRAHRAFFFLIGCAVVGILLAPRAFPEDKQAEVETILKRAKAAMDVRSADSRPFQFAAGFHFDGGRNNDDPPFDGLYTETWKSPTLWRLEIDVPDFTQVEIGEGDKRWLLHDLSLEPNHFSEVRRLFQFRDFEVDKINKVWETSLGIQRVQCIRSRDKGTQHTFCFDAASGVLVQAKIEGLGQQHDCEYSDYRKYVEKLYPGSIRCTENGNPWLEATITNFQADSSPVDSKLFVPASGAVEEPVCAKVESVHPLHTPDPVYPVNSPPPQGDTVFEGIVGVNGELTALTLKHSSGDAFDQEAVRAMRLWKFHPGTCAGIPIAVRVTFQIAFHPR